MAELKNKNKILNIIKIALLSLIVLFIGLYFMNKKENLDLDEMYTYGLSNTSFQLQVEDFKEYTGDELLKSYATVKLGDEFNIGNVIFNQEMDTHPPLYYMIVNFICSLRAGTFSMWYGLIINLIFLIILYHQMSYLLNLVIRDKTLSYVLSVLALFTYGFVNEMVFIRMYVMLSVISMAFVILIINKINNCNEISIKVEDKSNTKVNNILYPIDVKFQVAFFAICILGILTQYHFVIVAGFYSLVFAIYLIKEKRFKLLFMTLINGLVAIAISAMLFPGMINHIFGDASLHSLAIEQVTDIGTRFYEIIATVYQSFFGLGLYVYIVVLIIGIVLFIVFSKKSKIAIEIGTSKEFLNEKRIYISMLICCVCYYVIISLSSSFTFARYLYNIYPLIFIVIISPICILYKRVKPNLKYISVLLILTLAFTSKMQDIPFSLNAGDSLFYDFLKENKDTKMILLYRSIDKNGNMNTMGSTSKWKLPRPLYIFREMENMTFVDIGYERKLQMSESPSISGYDDIFLVIYTTEDDERLIKEVMQKNNVNTYQKIYFANYFHVYRLTR